MSYFDGAYTGQNALRWNSTTGGTWMYAQTPAVHDILAVQNVYGADYETRSGDTVYGFNSTADRAVFDFTTNDTPIVTIWDGGGNDTLDLSGFNSNAIIDINEGAFSSAGYRINATLEATLKAAGWTQARFDALYASWGLGPDGRPVDNIAIAYGAKIENAVGGSGNDQITGNALNNLLSGNGGSDRISGGEGNDRLFGGAGDDFLIGGKGIDVYNGGAGNDMIIIDTFDGVKTSSKSGNLVVEFVQDFNASGNDTIDLRSIDWNSAKAGDQAFNWIGTDANKAAGDLSYKVYDSINGAEKALGMDIDGVDGVGTTSGPVTVVFANVDGGAPDYALVLLGANGVSQGDFLF
jgi:serralysin